MNFEKIFKMQKELNEKIMSTHSIQNMENLKEKRLVALIVEMGEFANEYSPFKYWKKNITINKNLLIEEFVDGIHFLASIAIELNMQPNIEPIILFEDQSLQLLNVFEEIIILKSNYNKKQLEKIFSIYLGIAQQLYISEEEIEEFYIRKNKKNFERMENNY